MLTERPIVFEDGHSFLFLQQEHAEEVCEFLSNMRVNYRTQSGPGRTVKFSFASLSASDVERLMLRMIRA
jgi:hypothetical protein